MQALSFDSPLGVMTLRAENDAIIGLSWGATGEGRADACALLLDAKAQIEAYFNGRLRRFDVPMSCPSTPFQHGVLEALLSIRFGQTRTYGEIADYVEGSPQAVGRACGANPIPILIPCHRVLGAAGLGGFSAPGGVEAKVFLLRHENAAGLLL